MRTTPNIRYPSWVKPGHMVRGDVKMVYAGDQWNRFYWTGSGWVTEDRANIQLKQLSSKRAKHVKDQEMLRKS